MSQTVGELINKLAIQGGINAEDEGLKALLSNAALSNTEVPDNILTGINGSLLTVDSAKNNPTLKSHFFAQALNGVDTELSNLYSEFGLGEDVITELNAEKSSTKRTGLLARKIQMLEAAKSGQSKEGKDELQKTIDSLNEQIKMDAENHQQALTNLTNEHRSGIQDMLINTSLSGYDYSLPVDKEISIQTARQILNSELASKGGKVVLNDNNQLMLRTADGSQDFYIGNDKFDFKGFVDQTLANHKLLKATNDPAPNPGQAPIPGQGIPNGNPAPMGKPNPFLEAASKSAGQFDE